MGAASPGIADHGHRPKGVLQVDETVADEAQRLIDAIPGRETMTEFAAHAGGAPGAPHAGDPTLGLAVLPRLDFDVSPCASRSREAEIYRRSSDHAVSGS